MPEKKNPNVTVGLIVPLFLSLRQGSNSSIDALLPNDDMYRPLSNAKKTKRTRSKDERDRHQQTEPEDQNVEKTNPFMETRTEASGRNLFAENR